MCKQYNILSHTTQLFQKTTTIKAMHVCVVPAASLWCYSWTVFMHEKATQSP